LRPRLLRNSRHFRPQAPQWAAGTLVPTWQTDYCRHREGAKLIPPPIGDRYEDEAYRLLELKRGKRDLFGEEA